MAATMDMTPHAKGMVRVKKSVETVSIVMGNKQVSVAIGDIPGVVCDNQGNQSFAIRVTNVALVHCAFNLFSISQRLKQELSLGRDAHALEIDQPQWKEMYQV